MRARFRSVTARPVVGLLLVLTVGIGLTACRTNVGAAAFVGGERISESQLQDYVQPGATPFSVQNQDGSAGQVVPRSYVLQQLITGRVFEAVLRKNGGEPTAAELDAARSQVVGTATDASLTKELAERGFDASFEPVLVRSLSYIGVAQKRIGDTAKLTAAIRKAGVPVKVNPRYGSWDAERLSLDSTGGTPDFVAPSPATSSAAVPLGG